MKIIKYANATRVKLKNRRITVYQDMSDVECVILEFVTLDKKNITKEKIVQKTDTSLVVRERGVVTTTINITKEAAIGLMCTLNVQFRNGK